MTTGVRPKTCPPVNSDTFDPSWLLEADVIYLRLHGLPNQPYLYGDAWNTALSADMVKLLDLKGKTVFLEGCFGDGPMGKAFAEAGAAFVAGSPLATQGRPLTLGPSSQFGKAWLDHVSSGKDPHEALALVSMKFPGQDYRVI